MKTLVDILLEEAKENKEYFDNYQKYAEIIKEEAEKRLNGKVWVYLFGSVAEGKFNPSSDIDILIVGEEEMTASQRTEVKISIYKRIGLFSPFEIHLVTEEEYQSWYKRFIKKKIRIS